MSTNLCPLYKTYPLFFKYDKLFPTVVFKAQTLTKLNPAKLAAKQYVFLPKTVLQSPVNSVSSNSTQLKTKLKANIKFKSIISTLIATFANPSAKPALTKYYFYHSKQENHKCIHAMIQGMSTHLCPVRPPYYNTHAVNSIPKLRLLSHKSCQLHPTKLANFQLQYINHVYSQR